MAFGRFLRFHLSDRRLAKVYLADASGEDTTAVGRARAHLAGCRPCRQRFGHLQQGLETIAADMEAELDAAFPPDRLTQQRDQILRRLEHAGHPARVLAFPRAPQLGPRPRTSRRWIASAAAAGLFVGLIVGRNVPGHIAGEPAAGTPPAAVAVDSSPRPGPAAFNEETFLLEIDAQIGSVPRVAELEALDALTPHVVEAAMNVP